MTITYSDGRTVEAILLSRTENSLRLAVQGANDAMEFLNIRGVWISDDCEPVSIEFAWERHDRKPEISDADCICSHDLASRLIHLLYTDSSEDRIEMDAPKEIHLVASASQRVS